MSEAKPAPVCFVTGVTKAHPLKLLLSTLNGAQAQATAELVQVLC